MNSFSHVIDVRIRYRYRTQSPGIHSFIHLFLYLFNMYFWLLYLFSSVRSLSHVQLFGIPWTAARQTSLFITNSLSLLKFMSIESWCHPTISSSVAPLSSCLQSFPASRSFPVSQFFTSDGQSTGASASASVLSMNIQDWFPLGWIGWISCSPGALKSLLQYHCSKAKFFGAQLSW